MTIRASAYDTAACQGYNTQAIVHALEDYGTRNWGFPTDEQTNVLVLKQDSDATVPSFFYPMIIDLVKIKTIGGNTHSSKLATVSDIRAFISIDPATKAERIKSVDEYEFAVLRSVLNNIWINSDDKYIGSGSDYLRNLSDLPLPIYASLLSEIIANKLNLDMSDQHMLYILAGIFYLSNFTNEEPDEKDKIKLIATLNRQLKVNPATIQQVLSVTSYINSLTDFCVAAKELLDPVRLQHINTGLVVSMLGGVWWGMMEREVPAVALEHPPTFIAMLYRATQSRGYKNTRIMKIAERSMYKRQVEQFSMVIRQMLMDSKNR